MLDLRTSACMSCHTKLDSVSRLGGFNLCLRWWGWGGYSCVLSVGVWSVSDDVSLWTARGRADFWIVRARRACVVQSLCVYYFPCGLLSGPLRLTQ